MASRSNIGPYFHQGMRLDKTWCLLIKLCQAKPHIPFQLLSIARTRLEFPSDLSASLLILSVIQHCPLKHHIPKWLLGQTYSQLSAPEVTSPCFVLKVSCTIQECAVQPSKRILPYQLNRSEYQSTPSFGRLPILLAQPQIKGSKLRRSIPISPYPAPTSRNISSNTTVDLLPNDHCQKS